MRLWGRILISSKVRWRIFTLHWFCPLRVDMCSYLCKAQLCFHIWAVFWCFWPRGFQNGGWGRACIHREAGQMGIMMTSQNNCKNAAVQFRIMHGQIATVPPKLSRASCSDTGPTTLRMFVFQMLQRSRWRAIRTTTEHLRSLWPRCWKSWAWRTPQGERAPTWWRTKAALSGDFVSLSARGRVRPTSWWPQTWLDSKVTEPNTNKSSLIWIMTSLTQLRHCGWIPVM